MFLSVNQCFSTLIIVYAAYSQSFIRDYQDPLLRFINLIVKPVGVKVFGLKEQTLHVFYDLAPSPLIAFNTGGALFLNLRYYIAWHDSLVLVGNKNDALISTFHTLAHEIAHNLVGPHNSEHEYYFSSLLETHFAKMAFLLSSSSSSSSSSA